MNSLFQSGGNLVTNHITYVERDADYDALRIALRGEFLHVNAPRQTGKSSLLFRLADRLREEQWRSVYVDLSTLADLRKTEWYAELGREIADSLTPGEMPEIVNQIHLLRYLRDFAIDWDRDRPNIIILLDEVEGAKKAKNDNGESFSDTFFSTLRTLYTQRENYAGKLVIALAGAITPKDLVKDPEISPFNYGQEVDLDDLTANQSEVLTQHLTKLNLPVDTLVHDAIYDWTNGHPYLTQRICAELENKVHNEGLTAITPEVVTAVVEKSLLNPSNPLQQDSNLRHVDKMLNRLSAPAMRLWSRLQIGEIVSRQEAVGDLYLKLYLTGAVKSEGEHLIIRNRIYERAFAAKKKEGENRKANLQKQRKTTMSKSFRIFISSTWVDLQPEREAVEKALHRMQSTAFAGMEYFGSRSETPREVSLTEVDRSDVYIGIFAHRYGSGITEAEYRRALERDIPCLIYIKDDNVPIIPAHIERESDKVAKLEAFKRELKQNYTVSFFNAPDNLATQVVTDLHNLLGNMPGIEKEETPSGSKYHIHITGGQGIVIGDQSQVTQHFGSSNDSGNEGSAEKSAGGDDTVIEELHQTLLNRFDLEELRSLCFYLDVEFDDLRGEGRAAKARELIRLMQRSNQLDQLRTKIRQLRG